MKLLCTEFAPSGAYSFVSLGDNALLRNNEDFYLPSFAQQYSCVPQFVFRIGKIGKNISSRFAFRYIESVGVGLRFYADDLIVSLYDRRLPTNMGWAFDHAAAISALQPVEVETDYSLCFEVNGRIQYSGRFSDHPLPLDRLIPEVSEYYMFKIGDFLYCGNAFRYTGLKIGDRLAVKLNDQELLNFLVR